MSKKQYKAVTTTTVKKKTSSLAYWRWIINDGSENKEIPYTVFKDKVWSALANKATNFTHVNDLSAFFNKALCDELYRIVYDLYHNDVIGTLKKLNKYNVKPTVFELSHEEQQNKAMGIKKWDARRYDDVIANIGDKEISIAIPSIGYTWIVDFTTGALKLRLDPSTVKYNVPNNKVVQEIIDSRDGKTEYVVNNMIQFLIQQFRNGKRSAVLKHHEGYEDVVFDTTNISNINADEEVNIVEKCNITAEPGPEGAIINPEASKCISMIVQIDNSPSAVYEAESAFNTFVHLRNVDDNNAEFWWSANIDKDTSVLVQSILNYKEGTLVHKHVRTKQADGDGRKIKFVGANVELHGFKAIPKVEEQEKATDTENVPEPIAESKVIDAEVVDEQHAE